MQGLPKFGVPHKLNPPMKRDILRAFLVTTVWAGSSLLMAQEPVLPHGYAPWELEATIEYTPQRLADGITSPPEAEVRASAEWEEVDAIMVTWTGYTNTVREIVKYAQVECLVYIICADSNSVKADLDDNDIPLENIAFLQEPYNSIWIRDYGPWNVYTNQVDSLNLIDWVYNRPARPDDDAIPGVIADTTGLPIYQSIEDPWDLVATGGNFMTDGWGTGFSSKLILEENDGTGQSQSFKSKEDIDSIMQAFMGIDRYVMMETLPYDEIHHIDMHMKLLDEETLLVGEYPEGVADGPQIEENLQYVLDNYTSVFGTPYKVVRIPMPPDADGDYPGDGPWWNVDYRTYTNFVFINRLVLVPIYEEKYDTTALRILDEALPGYTIVGIDCNDIIQSLGAIHCITKEVASSEPLLISHQPLSDTEEEFIDYQVDAWIMHRDEVAYADIYYTTSTTISPATIWSSVPMTLTDEETDTWTGYIPAHEAGTTLSYYIRAEATTGKSQKRPITAPAGFWRFNVTEPLPASIDQLTAGNISVFPNPVHATLHVNLQEVQLPSHYEIRATDGRLVQTGQVVSTSWQTDVQALPSGLYHLRLESDGVAYSLPFVKQ